MYKKLLGLGGILMELSVPFVVPNSPVTGYVLAASGVVLVLVSFIWGWLDKRVKTPKPGSEHDIWLVDAINYVAFGQWDRPTDVDLNQRLKKVSRATDEVRQKSCDGELIIYGTEGFSNVPLLPIEKEYWEQYGLDFLAVMSNIPEELTTEICGYNHSLGVRRNLKTSKQKVKQIWG